MENATDALLMAFAVLIFIIALSVSLTTLSQAKSTADIVLFYSDRENFQTHVKADSNNENDGGRDVGVDTVISTITRCAKEKFSVKIIEDSTTYIFEYDIQKKKDIEDTIEKFIREHTGNKYRETYVEVVTGGKIYFVEDDEAEEKEFGKVVSGEDGTQLEQNVGKKIYITYEKIS